MLAPAKINLGLEIVRRRPDGYHDLNTLFAALDFGDDVRLASSDDHLITCSSSDPSLPVDERNLAVRAAECLRVRLGIDAGLAITIEKRIPMGAGLGGGSSDAAAVLMGAPEIWGIEADPMMLAELALGLGSDVPFFLGAPVALASGRGEILASVELALPWSVLLVNPGIHVSTPEAFAAVGRNGERVPTDLVDALRRGDLRGRLVNDFEAAVIALHPAIGWIKERIAAAGAELALMSGSGATVFGLFADRSAAEAARAMFASEWSVVCGFAG